MLKTTTRRSAYVALLGICLVPINIAAADSTTPEELSVQWWQWTLSIPTSVNPGLDSTGQNCMVGQRGSIWFLGGSFGGGTVVRTCSVPEGKSLFFPVINSVNINTPNVCGQGPNNVPVSQLRAANEAAINGVTELSVNLDGQRVPGLLLLQSPTFEVALPEDNLFDAPCQAAGLGNVPAGIYSPAVDEGYYMLLQPLSVGNHTLHFVGKSQAVDEDITYNLTVVPLVSGNERQAP